MRELISDEGDSFKTVAISHYEEGTMNKKDRLIGFTLSVEAIIFLIVIVYLDYTLAMDAGRFTEGSHSSFLYFVNIISAFLCSLLLQGEEILNIRLRRKSLFVRWELILLGIVAILFSFMNFRFVAGSLLDIVFMFAAGMFFVRAFHVKDGLMDKRDRTISFALNAIAVPLVMASVYMMFLIVNYIFTSYSVPLYLRDYVPYIGLFFTLVCALLLQGDEIIKIIHRRKSLLIRWELLILGIVALLFAVGKIVGYFYFAEHDYINSSSFVFGIIDSIMTTELWSTAYMFAVGMFFVHAFHIKTDLDQ